MGKNNKDRGKKDPSNGSLELELDDAIYRAAGELGWCFPVSEEDVAQEEERQDETSCQLPQLLQNPKTAWEESNSFGDDHRNSSNKIIGLPELSAVSEEMARVAREGRDENAISEDLQNRLRRDRRLAEQEEEDACPS